MFARSWGRPIVLEFVRRWWMTWFAAGNFRQESLIILATLTLQAGLGLRLAGQVIGLARRRWESVLSELSLSRASRVAAIVWRLLALVLLCACVGEAANLFAFSADSTLGIGGDSGQWELRWNIWLRQVVTGCTVLVLNSAWIARLLKQSGCLSALPSGDLADVLVRAVTYWDTLWFEEWFTYWSYAMWCPFLAWAALETLRLCGHQAPDRMTSFDAVATSRADAGRFLGLWTALAILVLCALPALFVAALVVYQTRLMSLG